jgi:hypothetical protein
VGQKSSHTPVFLGSANIFYSSPSLQPKLSCGSANHRPTCFSPTVHYLCPSLVWRPHPAGTQLRLGASPSRTATPSGWRLVAALACSTAAERATIFRSPTQALRLSHSPVPKGRGQGAWGLARRQVGQRTIFIFQQFFTLKRVYFFIFESPIHKTAILDSP